MANYVYHRAKGEQLWTVGYYTPEGDWQSESDHDTPDAAAKRVRYLNGGEILDAPTAAEPRREYILPDEIQAGERAFATDGHFDPQDGLYFVDPSQGMTKLEYMATHIMAGLTAAGNINTFATDDDAEYAVRAARALLAEIYKPKD